MERLVSYSSKSRKWMMAGKLNSRFYMWEKQSSLEGRGGEMPVGHLGLEKR